MSTQVIFVIALVVFALMVTGLVRTMREFNRITDEPSKKKGPPEEQ